MIGNQGSFASYRIDRAAGRFSVESMRRRDVVLSGRFATLAWMDAAEARSLGEALLRAADNAEGRRVVAS